MTDNTLGSHGEEDAISLVDLLLVFARHKKKIIIVVSLSLV